MSNDTSKLLKACVEYRAMVDKLERENAALREAAQLALDTIIDGHKNGFRANSGCYALPRLQAALGKEAQS